MIPLRTGLNRIMASAAGSVHRRRPRPARRTRPKPTTAGRGQRPGCRPADQADALPGQHADGGGPGSAEPRCPPPCSQRIRHVEARPGRPRPTGGEPPRAAPHDVRIGRRGGSRRTGGAGSTLAARGGHRRAGRSGREALATLATAGGDDRATRTGAHPKTEAVLLVPTTVVRLERPLAHWNDSGYSRSRMSTNPLIGSAQGGCPAHRRRNPQGAQHETAGSTPTDPRYVAACGQVKPGIPRLFHSLVDRIVGNAGAESSSPSGPGRH